LIHHSTQPRRTHANWADNAEKPSPSRDTLDGGRNGVGQVGARASRGVGQARSAQTEVISHSSFPEHTTQSRTGTKGCVVGPVSRPCFSLSTAWNLLVRLHGLEWVYDEASGHHEL
ncbi:unnamed protein product, partial [Ectocarpus sp. 12 AP-2014]